ncbi:MAG: filamentous hemagglutinin N-terminal domain-containing protein [Candidatus Scalindua sp. AMX11]|nr:MAG: filamentous hemagglutinin N-terminal domain-containing protein [Candidatus Scalindua sp.]TDE65664.1 MAG: filamentous hemagglutinin N-terminal domain-containing protein [Candidatus Scalindua sp. AMX11]
MHCHVILRGVEEWKMLSNQYCSMLSRFFTGLNFIMVSLISAFASADNHCETVNTHAAITADNTMNTSVEFCEKQSGGIFPKIEKYYKITEGTPMGGNLFHSFSKFNVPENESARFVPDRKFDNIISRVTGADISKIDGTIKSPATLYFLNPNGVIFGSSASLDVNGSFHVSTADYIRFNDNETFHADLSKNSTLTIASPVAFGFLNGNPSNRGSIEVRGSTLNSFNDSAISLVGGDIEINNGILNSPGGQINIASAASDGEVVFTENGIEMRNFQEQGTIEVRQQSQINVTPTVGEGENSSVYIRGGKFLINDSKIFANKTNTNNLNDVSKSIDIKLIDDFVSSNNTIRSRPLGSANGGGIKIEAENIRLSNGTEITAQSFADSDTVDLGDSGDITLITRGEISLSGSSRIDTSTQGDVNTGDAGTISIEAGSLVVEDLSSISSKTTSKGKGGLVTVNANNSVLIDGANAKISAETSGAGVGGNVELNVRDVTLTNSGTISTSALEGSSGKAGSITILKSDTVTVANGLLLSQTLSSGDAGRITVNTKQLNVKDGGKVSSSSTAGGKGGQVSIDANSVFINGADSRISAATSGGGIGGDVVVNADFVNLTDRGVISTDSSDGGNAGGITVTSDNLSISGLGSAISSSSQGAGDAGNIAVNVNDIVMNDKASIATDAAKADGGNIELTVHSLMHLVDSKVTSSVKGGADTEGGNITMNLKRGVLENSRIIANAFEGKGGNVQITAEVFLADPLSEVSASSDKGVDGEVNIRAPVTNISGNIAPLQKNFSSATSLLLKPCAVRMSGEKRSSLVLAGRDGLPFQPGDLIPSPLYDAAMAAVDAKMAGMNERLPLAYGVNAFEEKGLLPLDLLDGESECAMCP